MTVPIRLACQVAVLAAAALLAAGCTTPPAGELPAATAAKPAATTAAAEPDDEPAMERPEAAAQCWMKHDRSGGSLEAKAKLVDKCIAEKMKGN